METEAEQKRRKDVLEMASSLENRVKGLIQSISASMPFTLPGVLM